MKYLFIDGNNLGIRASFANSSLTSLEGVPSGMHYGFLSSILSIKNKFPDHKMVIAWDSKSKRRIEESENANNLGKIPSVYKANRKKDELPEPLRNFYEQSTYLKKGLGKLGIPQIKIDGYEADDVIASYVTQLKDMSEEIIILTSDADYYQLLDKNVFIYDGMKNVLIDLDHLQNLYGVNSEEFVHGCSIMGDDGDNIFGVPGWGDKKAMEEIKKHKTFDKVIDFYDSKYKDLRGKHPDLNTLDEGKSKFEELNNVTFGSGRAKYKNIYYDMPYSGVLYAYEKGDVKINKSHIMLLCFQDVIRLAYSLKKMDLDIILPIIPEIKGDKDKFLEYLDYYDMESLKYSFDDFFNK